MIAETVTYHRWANVPSYLKTTTQWRQLRRKPKHDAVPAAQFRGRHGNYDLFAKDQTHPIRQVSATQPQALPLTPENIGQALFDVNKAAKRRRDSLETVAQNRSQIGGLNGRGRNVLVEKRRYYELKEAVIAKAKAVGYAELIAYHMRRIKGLHQEDQRYSTETVYYELTEIGGFQFHTPIDSLPDGAEAADLGDWRSPATKGKLRLKDAMATLQAFLSSSSVHAFLKKLPAEEGRAPA